MPIFLTKLFTMLFGPAKQVDQHVRREQLSTEAHRKALEEAARSPAVQRTVQRIQDYWKTKASGQPVHHNLPPMTVGFGDRGQREYTWGGRKYSHEEVLQGKHLEDQPFWEIYQEVARQRQQQHRQYRDRHVPRYSEFQVKSKLFVCSKTYNEALDFARAQGTPRSLLVWVTDHRQLKGTRDYAGTCFMVGNWHYLPDALMIVGELDLNGWKRNHVG